MTPNSECVHYNKSGIIKFGFNEFAYSIKDEDGVTKIFVAYPTNYSELSKSRRYKEVFTEYILLPITIELKPRDLFDKVYQLMNNITKKLEIKKLENEHL